MALARRHTLLILALAVCCALASGVVTEQRYNGSAVLVRRSTSHAPFLMQHRPTLPVPVNTNLLPVVPKRAVFSLLVLRILPLDRLYSHVEWLIRCVCTVERTGLACAAMRAGAQVVCAEGRAGRGPVTYYAEGVCVVVPIWACMEL